MADRGVAFAPLRAFFEDPAVLTMKFGIASFELARLDEPSEQSVDRSDSGPVAGFRRRSWFLGTADPPFDILVPPEGLIGNESYVRLFARPDQL